VAVAAPVSHNSLERLFGGLPVRFRRGSFMSCRILFVTTSPEVLLGIFEDGLREGRPVAVAAPALYHLLVPNLAGRLFDSGAGL
jgi:hypothetical protein